MVIVEAGLLQEKMGDNSKEQKWRNSRFGVEPKGLNESLNV